MEKCEVCWYVVCGILVCDMWVCFMLGCDKWYVGMVIGIENVDVFVNFLVKVQNELKNQK